MTKQQVRDLQKKIESEIDRLESLPTDEYVDAVEMHPDLWDEFKRHGSVTNYVPPMDDGCVGMLHVDGVVDVFLNPSLVGRNVVFILRDF